MLMCCEGDERLTRIDGFELMDWHYALEQIHALDNGIETIHAVEFDSSSYRGFRYTRSTSKELINVPELEFQLVA